MLSVHSVAGQVFILQVAVVLLLVIAALTALVLQARNASLREANERSLVGAETFAHAPGTLAAMKSPDPSALLQPQAEAARKDSGVAYIIAFDTKGIRWTHPDPNLIGKHVVGSYAEALAGRVHQETYDTPGIGRAADSMVPVFDTDGKVVGLVSVGITLSSINEQVTDQLPLLIGSAVGGLALVTGGTALVSRRLRRQTHGLDPAEMTRMYEHHDAVLHSVREGVVVVSGEGRLLLANDEARRLLDLPEDGEGRRVTDIGLAPRATALLTSDRVATDEVILAGERLLAVNLRPTAPSGSVATLRDTTELRALAGRAEVARERLQLLYDAGVRIGTTLDVVRTAEELAETAVPRFADYVTVELLDAVRQGEEPNGDASPTMDRIAVRGVRDDHPLIPAGERITFVPTMPQVQGLHTGHAVLLPDLSDAPGWHAQDPERARRVLDFGIHSLITVPLQARDTVLGMVDFWRSDREPFTRDDLAFAEELAARAAVAVDNARRFTREHTMAVTLQRSLLPRGLPEQSGLEAAYRYLPAQAGVGGDWFDVIPLPGARVALVVGDVVGHGLHAAATMGRLRTAVHNFCALDLSPDELLSHLDELVVRIDERETSDGESEAITGATCLFAIYDPVSGHCTVARAGHPGPALVHPDGSVSFPDVPVSPPLGLGAGLPVETAELQLPDGSRLALYTDGLVEDRDRDMGVGLELLRQALAHPDRTPEQDCQAVFDALLPDRPRDDIALLVARTERLDPDRVADWDVPSDPAVLGPIRAACARRLREWGLDEIAFTTELILSELVTNAIRYGGDPICLRLLYDRDSLICEVADGSSTSPHLRRAATTDEGGRGLFLVAQFARRWGTRYTDRGKVIWSEQCLDAAETELDEAMGDLLLDQWDEPTP
ncbi:MULTISPECIES: SpoIIE family protein phosphatase [unclassified Streptomyces]|uniref:SpoIIE family protein phosphatase n=1 Tax=unclassified Streptomyces TaxID=2593676 RepID=UPI0023668CA7|nr:MULTISPECIES: SpoIIE family protein phosphatase [unclassified Streptomyces]MDF3145392.1 SpoIIE family protein phosphatase [Streptomyces sp. T21Q-yed]WDF44547.1 SpoIIE family protein phosphatase [Streptomyces sp. T12]